MSDRESELQEAGWNMIGAGSRTTLVGMEGSTAIFRTERLTAWRKQGREMVEGRISVGTELVEDAGETVPEGGSLRETASELASRIQISEYVFQSCVTAAEKSKS